MQQLLVDHFHVTSPQWAPQVESDRLVVAWMLAHRESGDLTKDLFSQAYDQQGSVPGQLTVHNDHGSAPTAKTLYQLDADLGVERSVSRPYVSNDNSCLSLRP